MTLKIFVMAVNLAFQRVLVINTQSLHSGNHNAVFVKGILWPDGVDIIHVKHRYLLLAKSCCQGLAVWMGRILQGLNRLPADCVCGRKP